MSVPNQYKTNHFSGTKSVLNWHQVMFLHLVPGWQQIGKTNPDKPTAKNQKYKSITAGALFPGNKEPEIHS